MKQFDEITLAVAKKMDEKKARDIVLLDVQQATILAETFLICSGTSANQVRMLAEEAEKTMAEYGIFARRMEGYREGRWVVVDFGGLMVHIFHREEREFYNIERLWKTDGNFMNYVSEAPEK